MSVSEDWISFDIIESHKENIQPLVSGRSAKSLAATFAPMSRSHGATLGGTRNLNDAIREEYELELKSIQDSDDPLDVYDRYVKWTLGAYPSAQATPESQLRPLLERGTKAFQSVTHYKNDPRYLKLWLHFIRFFSDAPRETFAYLARHNIGEGLALFYEEFAAWLEGAGRWKQTEEVYRLGIEREARPVERLIRKFSEFQKRTTSRSGSEDEPSSPVLPIVRPALVAKIDPFTASTPRPTDPQAPRPSSSIGGSSTSRGSRHKLTIFSDSGDPASSQANPDGGGGAMGWETIGTIADRKKENIVEARPWSGETLKARKQPNYATKMAIFKDESKPQMSPLNAISCSKESDHQQIVNLKTGKIERVFVNLASVYPDDKDPYGEMSFEELRAQARGWLGRKWAAGNKIEPPEQENDRSIIAYAMSRLPEHVQPTRSAEAPQSQQRIQSSPSTSVDSTMAVEIGKEDKVERSKKMRIKEIKGATQTIKTNLESPTGRKLRRKNSSEPTMTLHTKAATDDILDIFNQPLRNLDPMAGPSESDVDTDYDDDDYTSAGESTGTGRISGTSEFGDTEPDIKTINTDAKSIPESVSPWSDFTASKHVPGLDQDDRDGVGFVTANVEGALSADDAIDQVVGEEAEGWDIVTPISPEIRDELYGTKYVPIPPEDYEPPERHPRDPAMLAQNRPPFMTPIIEKTETSLGIISIHADKDYFDSKTPSRHDNGGRSTPIIDGETLSSPFHEIVNEARPPKVPKLNIAKKSYKLATQTSDGGPVIGDIQCNPVDDAIRSTILNHAQPPLSSNKAYHDHRLVNFARAVEIRKFIKLLSKAKTSEKTTTSISVPPVLRFDNATGLTYTIRREIGQGAFAPVYLAEQQTLGPGEQSQALIAIKSEYPPTSWEFHMMEQLHSRLGPGHRATASLLRAHSIHLYKDEGYLLEQYLDQGTLLDLVNLAKSDSTSGQTTLDESVAMFFTVELLRTVAAMHNIGILHGDLKADNCLVRLAASASKDEEWDAQYQRDGSLNWSSKGLALIDFGRAIDMRAFRPDVQFIADWKTSKQDCIEMRELRPWTYQIDYYGMAGVVHSLLFGKYIEDCVIEGKDESGGDGVLGRKKKYKIREGLKRYWQTELWRSLFDLLLNPLTHVEREPDGRLPCDKGLKDVRESMEVWLAGEGGRRNGGLKNGLARLEIRIRERKGR